MRLFAYQGSDGNDGVGALIKGSTDEFVDLCATDNLIPTSNQSFRKKVY